ncbi:MAG: hypothetical protein Kow0069_35140 [Promethearchaeota archaeon]
MPSDVRLFYQSEVSLGRRPRRVLAAFGVEGPDRLEAFFENNVRSGVALLTLFVRTARRCRWGVEGPDYWDVWLDKDCVVAADGTLHFADLEGWEWFVAGQDFTLEERVRKRWDRNFYEFAYGMDLLLSAREAMGGTRLTQAERRREAAGWFEVALAGDSFVECDPRTAGLDIHVKPPRGLGEAVAIRAIDFA